MKVMKKRFFILILAVPLVVYSQDTSKSHLEISTKICDCISNIKTTLTNTLINNCFKKVYSENKTTMDKMLKELSKENPKLTEKERKNIVGNKISKELALNCKKLGELFNRKGKAISADKLLGTIATEVCTDFKKKFKSEKEMTHKTVDPIFIKYFEKYYTEIIKKYGEENISDFSNDLVNELLKTCSIYRKWTIHLTSKK